MAGEERRRFSRVPFHPVVIARNRSIETDGRIENLSLHGALLNMKERIDIGCDLEIEIFLTDPAADISIKVNGKVVRYTPEGAAIQFTGMYLDDFGRLRDRIASILGDKKKVVEEFFAYLTAGD